MRPKHIVVLSSLALLALAPLSQAQPRPGTAELPIKQIVLFSSGVGYFQREGQVDGHSRIDLQFHMDNINDLLKSLILEDRGGGQVAPVINYDNRNPIDLTLRSFAIDLTHNPSLGDLLNQVRGEQVEVLTSVDSKGVVGQSETINGLVVGVEKQRQPVGKDQFVDVAQLNMLTKEGLRGVPLGQVQRVRFLKPGLDQEFRKALEVLATGHDKQKKTVSLNFSGEGKRSVKVGYVTESPIWKTSYRLSVRKDEKNKDKDKVFLQGWAVVENTTDEDWNGVQLGLVSGRPISFQMDLYQPLFVSRPVVELELFASLKPPVYGGDLEREDAKGKKAESRAAAPAAPPDPGLAAADGRRMLRQESTKALSLLKDKADRDGLNFHQDVATAAVSTELGDYFQYIIKQPVSLPRQKSALLPILNDEVEGSKVSIYNPSVHPKFPLLGLRFTNSTALHLCQGPITVFENDTYAGDARISDLQPKETRLLSYAIDLGTEVDPQQKDVENLLKIKVVRGIVHQEFIHKEIKTYRIKNRSDHTRTLLVEHPYRPAFKLIAPEKPTEKSRDVYRFQVTCEPNKPVDYVVEEHLPRFTQTSLSNSNDDTVRFLIRSTASSSKVKTELEKALSLKAKMDEVRLAMNTENQFLKEIEREQTRIRENMKTVPQTSELYKRYLKKFEDQENEVDQRKATLAKQQKTFDDNRKTYETFLANLSVE